MRILVLGSGGREHALVWKLAQEATVFAAPGNPGMLDIATCLPISLSEFDLIYQATVDHTIDLVVCGPEDPLVNGLGDYLRERGVAVYGPSKAGAALEASKAFSKDVMVAAGVPTAAFGTFSELDAALAFVAEQYGAGKQLAVKASGNALGKGVVVAETQAEAEAAVRSMLEAKVFGEAGATVVLEERLIGREFSLLTIVGDHNFVSLPVAQDYKRAFDGDTGPNTGGMGSYSPASWVTPELIQSAEDRMVAPLLAELKRRGISYRGTLFSGVMVVNGEPICLEYNVRFGDPETQSVMCRLGTGFAEALYQAATGEFVVAPEVLDNAVTTIVIAAGDYPVSGSRGATMTVGALPDGVTVFHAGTKHVDGVLVTNGGRVCCVTAIAADSITSRASAYAGARQVHFDGARFRSDIGL